MPIIGLLFLGEQNVRTIREFLVLFLSLTLRRVGPGDLLGGDAVSTGKGVGPGLDFEVDWRR